MNQRLHRIHLKLPRYISESRLATVAVVLGKTHETQNLKECNAISEAFFSRTAPHTLDEAAEPGCAALARAAEKMLLRSQAVQHWHDRRWYVVA